MQDCLQVHRPWHRAYVIRLLLLLLVVNCFGFVMAPEPSIHEDSENCWIFHHLEKSGGTTIREIVNPPLGKLKGSRAPYYSKEWKQGQNFTSNVLPLLGNRITFLSGGYVETLQRDPLVVGKCKFFTMFRHPVARMVSAYFFCKYKGTDPLCGSVVVDANKVSVQEWAKHWGNYALRQFAMRFFPVEDILQYIDGIASANGTHNGVQTEAIPGWVLLKLYLQHLGKHPLVPEEEHEEIILLAVLDKIMDDVTKYKAVGITEEFYLSMLLYDSTIRLPGVKWEAGLTLKGTANKDKKHEAEEKAVRDIIFLSSETKRYLRLDIVLYDHASAVFRHQLKEYGIKVP